MKQVLTRVKPETIRRIQATIASTENMVVPEVGEVVSHDLRKRIAALKDTIWELKSMLPQFKLETDSGEREATLHTIRNLLDSLEGRALPYCIATYGPDFFRASDTPIFDEALCSLLSEYFGDLSIPAWRGK
jgi:methyl coenzyme M reductase subunit D